MNAGKLKIIVAFFFFFFFFQNRLFSINSFRNTKRVSDGLGLDQDRRSVGPDLGRSVDPDLGANCLLRLSADDKSFRYSKERVISYIKLIAKFIDLAMKGRLNMPAYGITKYV